MVALAPLALAADYLWPVQPKPGSQSPFTQHIDLDGSKRLCGPGELSDADIEHARQLGLSGASSEEINTYLDNARNQTPPRCVTLGKVPH